MSRWYMLDDDKNVIPAPMDADGKLPTKEYFDWLESQEGKIIKQETVNGHWISTVFLGIDHGFGREGPPVVFETMIFPNAENMHEKDCWRYATHQEALEGHKNACKVAESYGSGLDPEEIRKGAAVIEALLQEKGKLP